VGAASRILPTTQRHVAYNRSMAEFAADDPTDIGPEADDQPAQAFEAEMRTQHRDLIVQMADREHFEFDPMWIRIGRMLLITLATLAIGGFMIFAIIVLIQNA
jgi:hypothetical protein